MLAGWPFLFLCVVFSVVLSACVAERNHKNPSLVALDERFKRGFVSALGGHDGLFLRSEITGRSNGHAWFANLVQNSIQHGASPLECDSDEFNIASWPRLG
jgi:hypothetical protein